MIKRDSKPLEDDFLIAVVIIIKTCNGKRGNFLLDTEKINII